MKTELFCKKPFFTLLFIFGFVGNVFSQTNAWINEIHYDNSSTDINESIEIVIENVGTLSDYIVYTYNGSNGTIIAQETLNNIAPGATIGNFTIYTWSPSSLQNGDPDGMALAYDNNGDGVFTLIPGQFLSYEGSFVATDGPAIGVTSIDIGVSETSSTLSTESLQLSGPGGLYTAFTWQAPATSTFGSVNTGQTLTGGGNPVPFISNITQTPTAGSVTPSDVVSVSADVTDADGIASVTLNWGTVSGNLTNSIVMSLGTGNTYTTNSSIPAQTDGMTVFYEIVAVDNFAPPATTNSSEQSYISQTPIPAPTLIISEVADPSDGTDAGFVEVYNNGTTSINFNETIVNLVKYANGTTTTSVILTGGLAPGDFYIISEQDVEFNTAYGFDSDLVSGIAEGNGDDVFALYVGGDEVTGTLFDIYGVIGTDGTGQPWEYENSRAIRNNLSTAPNTTWTASEWIVVASPANIVDMTPGQGETTVAYIYNGTSWSPNDPNGNATASDNITIQSGIATFANDIAINNLTINTGATLNVEQVLSVNETITNNGSLVFISDGTKLGQLAAMPTAVTIPGVTVQRYIPARRAFRFISPSVTTATSIHDNWQEGVNNTGTNFPADNKNPNQGFGTHISGSTTGLNGFDATISGNPSLFLFDNVGQTWGPISDTDVNVLEAGKAYRLFVRGDRSIDLTNNGTTPTNTTLRATGSLNTAAYTNSNLSQTAGEFNFIGNPYRAIVNINDVLVNSTNLNTNQYYVWDPNLNARGGYVTVDLSDGTPVPAGSDANQYLQPGQAAFVTTATSASASILFEQTDKAPFQNPTAVFRGVQNTTEAFIALQLYEAQAFDNGGSVADGVLLKFDTNESNTVLLNDAAKLGNIDENLAVVNGPAYLSIENRALPIDGEVLQLFNNQYRHSNYTYKAELSGFSDEVTVYLKDNYLNSQTLLTNDDSTLIDFSVDENVPASIAFDRFSFVFAVNGFSVEEQAENTFVVYPNPSKNRTFFISTSGMTGENVQISLYNLLGQEVCKTNNKVDGDQQIQINAPQLTTGIYVVKMTYQGETFTKKLILQ